MACAPEQNQSFPIRTPNVIEDQHDGLSRWLSIELTPRVRIRCCFSDRYSSNRFLLSEWLSSLSSRSNSITQSMGSWPLVGRGEFENDNLRCSRSRRSNVSLNPFIPDCITPREKDARSLSPGYCDDRYIHRTFIRRVFDDVVHYVTYPHFPVMVANAQHVAWNHILWCGNKVCRWLDVNRRPWQQSALPYNAPFLYTERVFASLVYSP